MDAELARAQAANDALRATRDDRWYPLVHVAARAGWMNDPNGVCFYQGRYHVFYQHHPYDSSWGPMHWGHVSSPDLVTWRREPIALAPDRETDRDGVWSGSAVVDDDGVLQVFYTGHRWRNGVDESDGNVQVQCRAESTDGVHLTKQGVVVEGPAELLHFRDPKVWREGERWHMIFGASSAQARGQVWMYVSDDLRTWTFDRIAYEDPDPDVYMIECPDLFALDGRWVLVYCPMSHARPSGYDRRNGHNAGYVVGTWAPGEDFRTEHGWRPIDWGHHYYAPQSMLAPDGRRLVIGWMGGFTLPLASQARDGWSGQLALPREVTLPADGVLRQRPYRELVSLRDDTVDLGARTLGVDEDLVLAQDVTAIEVELDVDLAQGSAEQVVLQLLTPDGHGVTLAYDDQARRVVLDRGLHAAVDRGRRSAPYGDGDRLVLHVVVDRGSVECFVGDGAETVSSLAFVGDGPRRLVLSSVSGTAAVTVCRVHRLRSIGLAED